MAENRLAGESPDTPLADLYTTGRVMRLADGPDEVHLQTIAKLELREREGSRLDTWKLLSNPRNEHSA